MITMGRVKRRPLAVENELTDEALLAALAGLPTASVLVVGWRVQWAARKLLRQDEFSGLKMHVDPDRDPDAWELF